MWLMDDQPVICDSRVLPRVSGSIDEACAAPAKGGAVNFQEQKAGANNHATENLKNCMKSPKQCITYIIQHNN